MGRRMVYCGNFDRETRTSDLENIFSKYGRINRIVRKRNFSLFYFNKECDARDAIRNVNKMPFGRNNYKLDVEWSKYAKMQDEDRSGRSCSPRRDYGRRGGGRDASRGRACRSNSPRQDYESQKRGYGDRSDSPRRNYRRHRDGASSRSHSPVHPRRRLSPPDSQRDQTRKRSPDHDDRLDVEWSKGESSRRHFDSGSDSNPEPNKTLFVSNLVPYDTKEADIESHFVPYGKPLNIRMGPAFALVEFETLEEATKAKEGAHERYAKTEVKNAKTEDEDRAGRSNSPRRDYESQRRGYGDSRRRGDRSNSPRRNYRRHRIGGRDASRRRGDKSNSPRRNYRRHRDGASSRSHSPVHPPRRLSPHDSQRDQTRMRSPDHDDRSPVKRARR